MPSPAPALNGASQAISKGVFYFDLSSPTVLPIQVVTTCIKRYGGHHATFLDKNVTHLVTDKASAIADAYSNVQKWRMAIWSVGEFVAALLKCMEANQDHFTIQLIKDAVGAPNKNLNECLAEEKKTQRPVRLSRMTPLFAPPNRGSPTATAAAATTRNVGRMTTTVRPVAANATSAIKSRSSSATKSPYFQPFQWPFILIESIDLCYASIYKQYQPSSSSGRATYPKLHYDATGHHSPFFNTRAHPRTVAKPAEEEVPLEEPKKEEPTQKEVATIVANENTAPTTLVPFTPRTKSKTLGKRSYLAAELNRKPYVPKPRPGYCECCLEKYENLVKHINSGPHRRYARDGANYETVDDMIMLLERPSLYDYNPIPYWKSEGVLVHPTMMSPANSCAAGTLTKKAWASCKLVPSKDLAEDKENDTLHGLDLTGVDRKMAQLVAKPGKISRLLGFSSSEFTSGPLNTGVATDGDLVMRKTSLGTRRQALSKLK